MPRVTQQVNGRSGVPGLSVFRAKTLNYGILQLPSGTPLPMEGEARAEWMKVSAGGNGPSASQGGFTGDGRRELGVERCIGVVQMVKKQNALQAGGRACARPRR